jgi:outer membrane receptor protein involved in Fe transport
MVGRAGVFLLIAGLALTARAAGQERQGPITGVVVDPSGGVIVAAVVVVEGDRGRAAAARTSVDGRFIIPDPPAGILALRVTATGFSEAVLAIDESTVRDGSLRVVLQPAGLFETVTVTASRSDERLATPAATTVLTSVELTSVAAGPVDDALRNTPGFGLTRRSSSRVANPSSQGVSIRGLTGNAGSRTLVLADGLPLNDPFGGWVYWNRIPEAALDRIEVVRGAAGDLYGGDAISGVIQLLTFSAVKPRVRATADAGSASTRRASLFGGGGHDAWSASIAGEWVRTDGEPVVAAAERGPVDVPAYSDYRGGLATLGYEGNGWRASGRVSVYQEARGNGTLLITNDTNWRQFSSVASGNLAGGMWSMQGSAGRQHYFNNFSSIPVGRLTERLTSEQRVPSTFATGVAQWVKPWKSHVFLVGAEAKRTEGTVNDTPLSPAGVPGPTVVAGGVEHVESVYGRAALLVAPRFTVIAGGRADFWTSTPEEAGAPAHAVNFFSPRVSAAWQASGTIAVRASATRASRTPTLDELHRSSRIGNTLQLGNPLLDPERLTALEAGVTVMHARTSARATWFWNDLTQAITNITIGTTATQVTRQKQNADNVRAQGLELDADVRPLQALKLNAGVVFTSSRFRNEVANPALEGLQVPQIASIQFNGAVTWTGIRALTLSAQWRGSNRQFEDDLNTLPLDGYGVLDVYASRAIARGLEVFAACENLFDAEYQTGKTGNPPLTKIGWPRTWRAGVRVALP